MLAWSLQHCGGWYHRQKRSSARSTFGLSIYPNDALRDGAAAMSAFGTKQTSETHHRISAFGGKADTGPTLMGVTYAAITYCDAGHFTLRRTATATPHKRRKTVMATSVIVASLRFCCGSNNWCASFSCRSASSTCRFSSSWRYWSSLALV